MVRLLVMASLVVAPAALACDAPEISRSAGSKSGVVVLWPRVVPESADPAVAAVAAQVAERLGQIAATALPEAKVDARPAPQRVCPRSGCNGPALGAVLMHEGGGCALVATVTAPGEAPVQIVPWGATVTLKVSQVDFRTPPEAAVTVSDFVPCATLLDGLTDADVATALQSARP